VIIRNDLMRIISRSILLAGLLCFVFSGRLLATEGDAEKPGHRYEPGHGIHWVETFEKALEEARESRRPVLIDFEAEWCGWCKKLDRETYGDERVIRLLHDGFVAVKVDVDKRRDVAKKHKVDGLPTILVLSPSGTEVQRIAGFRPPERFLAEITKTSESAKTLQSLKEKAEASPRDIALQRSYGRALFAAGNGKDAERILEEVLQQSPDHPGTLLDLADLQNAQRRLKDARETYERILGLRAQDAGAEKIRASLPLGRILVNLKEYEAGIAMLGSFIDRQRGYEGEDGEELWKAYFWRGYAHAVRKDAESALADLKVVQEKDKESSWGLRAGYIIDLIDPGDGAGR